MKPIIISFASKHIAKEALVLSRSTLCMGNITQGFLENMRRIRM
ncbi:hypothetical protein [Paenibacillus sp. EKM211P]|nr:hypothetical protein [Paenibacillus sp. EKM211P]